VRESFAGAWQQNVLAARGRDVTANSAVFASVRLISTDVAKLPIRLMAEQPDGTWREASPTTPGGGVLLASKFPPELRRLPAILREPNGYQTRQQFIASWVSSLELCGNAFVFPQRTRGATGDLVAFHVLDPWRVMPLVSESGEVLYRVMGDNLAGEPREFYLLASEIIHDRVNCLYHPLVGVSPLHASSAAAGAASAALANAEHFFGNQSTPGGVLLAPGPISDETAERLKASMTEFRDEHSGELLVLGDGLKYEPLALSNEASQLVELLGLTAVDVCRAFGVPGFLIGAAPVPAGLSVEALTSLYYAQTLQTIIEGIEAQLDRVLGLPPWLRTEFDLAHLTRMDLAGEVERLKVAIGAGIMAPNEARLRLNLPPVDGGDSPYLQQQNFSLAALAKRDAREDPFAVTSGADKAKMLEAESNSRAIRVEEHRALRAALAERPAAGVTATNDEPRSGAGYFTRDVVPASPLPKSARARRAAIIERRRAAMRALFASDDEGGST
jgi:HK97 family phage portal protein